RIHDHFRAHVAEQQVVAVALALVQIELVTDLTGRAGKEAVLEVGLEQRAPEIIEYPRQPVGAAALPGWHHDAHVLGWKRLGARAQRAERQSGRAARDDAPSRRVRQFHAVLLAGRILEWPAPGGT